MAKYRLQNGSEIFDAELNISIPANIRNRDWRKYQAWLNAGNTPDPILVPAYTGAQALSALRSQHAAIQQNSLTLNIHGNAKFKHHLHSLWYDVIISDPTLTIIKTKQMIKISGGAAKQTITFRLELHIPQNLNHMITRRQP